MWGVIPAAGNGTRIQPLAFSKELLPVGSRRDVTGIDRPRAVSEYLVERMILAGVKNICFVISSQKSDILQYYGGTIGDVELVYVCQDGANGLCDALFRAMSVIPSDEPVLIGLPDTVWFPSDALAGLPNDRFSFLLFPVARPEFFDAVSLTHDGRVLNIEVKAAHPKTSWIWGAMKMPGTTLHSLHRLWKERGCKDEFFGTLVNAWLDMGEVAWGVQLGTDYVDVGTLHGYREAMALLDHSSDLTASEHVTVNQPLVGCDP